MTYTLRELDREQLWVYLALTMQKVQQTGKRATTTLRMRNDVVLTQYDIKISITPGKDVEFYK